MTRPIVVKGKKKTNFIETVNQNNSLIFTVFCFLLGLLIGVLIFKFKSAEKGYYSSEFKNLYSELSGGFLSILINSLLRQLPFAAAMFLSGTCMVGAVMVPTVVAIRGISLGLSMGYLYATYSLTGIVFNLLILIPSAVISALALILSARESLGFSLSLARLAMPGAKKPEIEQDFKLYCLRQLFVLLIFTVAALIQTFMAISFISFFEL